MEEARLRFGALQVIDNLNVQLDEGEAVGVVGPNGAGKTTMLNLLAGQLRPDSGRIHFDGQDVTAMGARRRCLLGIARTYQIPQPFAGMTVFENALVGASFGSPGRSDAEAADAAVAALHRTGLLGQANRLAGSLTLLERKRLELARALATGPRVLLLDEIAGGLTEPEVQELVATVRELRAAGVTILWIEHIVHALVSVVDRLIAVDFGRKLIEGRPQAVLASPEVRDVYLGAEAVG
ncbi:MAG TPA: ABC transporter ATP-binding protein [Actinomycetes bacterium]|jgi:branched-chain amino acid transport system ATP-binding protein|nr:ABC transporter ATP-binding protein [Actinomycetes bacterium]HEX2159450.1 ABC transporter ATP-binding protein [Actinomycetes bacterium]